MNHNPSAGTASKVTLAGLLITLGIVYGDVGTSPLYTIRAILNGASVINESFVLGAISCVFWTLTLQTTVTLRRKRVLRLGGQRPATRELLHRSAPVAIAIPTGRGFLPMPICAL